MKHYHSLLIAAAIAALAGPAQSTQNTELEQLRAEINRMRTETDARISVLEDRLRVAESRLTIARNDAQDALEIVEDLSDAPQQMPPTALSDFNPAVGVVLIGSYNDIDTVGYQIPGIQLGDETGPPDSGISLGETEINFQANVDDKFFGNVTLAVAAEDGETEVELEEAYIQTLSMPLDLTVTGGRFFSSLGYLNGFHAHADDFIDRPLPYQALLGSQYLDDGVRLSWLVPVDFFLELGGERFRGEHFPVTGSANGGEGAWTLYAKTGGDIGMSSSWGAGLALLDADVQERATADNPAFTGSSKLRVLDFVYKWAPGGNSQVHNFKLQGEYFSREEKGLYGSTSYQGDQHGWYFQGVFQFRPGWRVGYRRDELRIDNTGVAGTELDDLGIDPSRNSFIVEWKNREFSRIRLQYTRDESSPTAENWWSLQYIMNIGAHGAHQF